MAQAVAHPVRGQPDARALPAWLAAAAVGAVALLHLWRLWLLRVRYFDLDEFEHLHAAWYVSRGAVPYRDFFEHHTPALYYSLAPFFAGFDVAADVGDAIRFLFFARALMWVLTALVLALAFILAARWGGASLGAVATLLLATTVMFVQKTLETRPDVPALALWLASLITMVAAMRSAPARRAALNFGAGVCLGAGLLFTQKLLFTLPGVLLALAIRPPLQAAGFTRRIDLRAPAHLLAGAALPLALALGGFAAAGALRDFVHFNLLYNLGYGRAFPATRYLVELAAQNPVLIGLGAVGMARSVSRLRARTAPAGTLLFVASMLSLVTGVFLIPAPFPQYLLLFLPLLALFAADALLEVWRAAVVRWGARLPARAGAFGVVLLLLAVTIHPLEQIRQRGKWRHGSELERMRYVHENTGPGDTVLGGWAAGAGVFRPHAFFYFYFSTRELVDKVPETAKRQLVRDLRSGAVAPKLVLFDVRLQRLSDELVSFVEAEYEPVPEHSLIWQPKRAVRPGASR